MRARSLFRRDAIEREMNEELRDHLERQTEALRARGLSAAEATRRARATFGGVDQAREGMRDERGVRWLEDLFRDLRLGARTLIRRPLFLVTSAVTLGLGIAAATSIFSVVSLVLLRPLDVSDPDELVAFGHHARGSDGPSPSLSFPMVRGLRQLDVFSGVLAQANEEVSLADVGRVEAEVLYGNAVTGNYFTMLGVRPVLGRFFTEGEDDRQEPVIVLSNRTWRTRYAEDSSVIGRSVSVNGLTFTVIGVTPPEFHGLEHLIDAQFFYPLGLRQRVAGAAENDLDTHRTFLRVLARLAPGRTLNDAKPQLAALATRIAAERGLKPGDLSFLSEYERRARPVIVIAKMIPAIAGTFLGLAVLALCIACINVGNLVLARTMARSGELAVRRSLGASRARVARQLMAESLLLGAAALLVAIPVAWWVVQWISGIRLAADIPLLIDVRLDWGVLGFAAAIAILAGLVTGLAPVLRGSADGVATTLREESRGSTETRGRKRAGAVLLSGQLAFSLVLVIAGALFTRSLRSVTGMDLGLDPDGVAMASVDLSLNHYTSAQARDYFRRATEAIAALPGVEGVATLRDAPMGFNQSFMRFEHMDKRLIADAPWLSAHTNDFTPEALAALKFRLIEGRSFDQFDDSTAPRRAIVTPEFVRRFWPGERSVIGQRFQMVNDSTPIEVIGVMTGLKSEFPTEVPVPQVFMPYAQRGGSARTFYVRMRDNPADALPAVGRVLRALDPAVAVSNLRTMHAFLHNGKAFFLYRLASALTLALGLLGVLQTLVGLYGVIAYGVSQRAQEFGIRVALGAARGQLVRQAMRPGVLQIGAGGILGVVLAALALPAAGNVLAISPRDPVTYAACAGALIALALMALYLPVRRAAAAEPMRALRRE